MEKIKVLIVGQSEKTHNLASYLISKEYEVTVISSKKYILTCKKIDVIIDMSSSFEELLKNIDFYIMTGISFLTEFPENTEQIIKKISGTKINCLTGPFDLSLIFKKIIENELHKIKIPKEIEKEPGIEKDFLRESFIIENRFILEINYRTNDEFLWKKGIEYGINFIYEKKFFLGTVFKTEDIFV